MIKKTKHRNALPPPRAVPQNGSARRQSGAGKAKHYNPDYTPLSPEASTGFDGVTPPSSTAADTITVLGCADARYRATKIYERTSEGINTKGYNAGMFFRQYAFTVTGIQHLSLTLKRIESNPHALVIRGSINPDHDPSGIHQRMSTSLPNFHTRATGNQWVMIDIDKLTLPKGLTLRRRKLNAVLRYVIGLLPKEFHDVSYHWQLSSSAGVSDPSKVSIHLWFWLDRPVPDKDLKRWGKAVNAAAGFNLIDTSLFNDVQAHYTAAPIFKNMADPFPVRSGLVMKAMQEVPLVLPVETPAPLRAVATSRGKLRTPDQTGHGFDHHLAQIGDHAGGDGFHGPIIQAAASYVGTRGADGTDVEWLYETISARVLAADSSKHDWETVQLRASREHIIPAIEGAIAKYGQAAEKRRKPRLVTGVEPHYKTRTVSLEVAQRCMQRLFTPR